MTYSVEQIKKLKQALELAWMYFRARDEMNAKIHCESVRLSEITVHIAEALKAIDPSWDIYDRTK